MGQTLLSVPSLDKSVDDPELTEIRARKLRELMRISSSPVAPAIVAKPFALTDATFDAEITKSGVILVDFWAAWCGPCLRIAPVLEQIAADMAGRVRIGKLNVDENPRTAARFQVMSIPTMLVFKDGRLVDGIVGAYPRAEIEAVLRRWA